MIMEKGVAIEQIVRRAIEDGLTIEIEYVKNNSEKSLRVISDVSLSKECGSEYVSAYCHKSSAQRTFKISRIVDARIVPDSSKSIVQQSYNYEYDGKKPIFNLYGEKYGSR